jgi:transposase-like protein
MLDLVYVQGKSWRQVAEHFGVTPGTVRTWRQREDFRELEAVTKEELQATLQSKLLHYGETALDTCVDICRNSPNDAARIAAARAILDRLMATKFDASVTDTARTEAFKAAMLAVAHEEIEAGRGLGDATNN